MLMHVMIIEFSSFEAAITLLTINCGHKKKLIEIHSLSNLNDVEKSKVTETDRKTKYS